ncbi:MAG: hypothetical protein V3S14_02060 [Anaerolineae bacterium]
MTGTREPEMHEWRSYDSTVAAYDRIWAFLFTLPARDSEFSRTWPSSRGSGLTTG